MAFRGKSLNSFSVNVIATWPTSDCSILKYDINVIYRCKLILKQVGLMACLYLSGTDVIRYYDNLLSFCTWYF